MTNKIFKIIIAFYIILSIAVYTLMDSYILQDTLYMIPVFMAAFASIILLKNTGTHRGFGLTITLITLGFIFWTIGEIIFIYYADILEIDPFPSIADIFYMLAYPLFLAGIINEIKNYGVKMIKSFSLFKTSSLILLTAIVIYIQIHLITETSSTIAEATANSLYGLGDVLIIIGIFLLLDIIFQLKNAKFSKPWIIFMVGMGLTLIADLLFAIFNTQYEEGIKIYLLMDVIFLSSSLFFTYSFYLFNDTLYNLQKKIKEAK